MGKAGIYKPRQPQKTAPFRIFSQYYETFKDIYNEKYMPIYGPFRPIIDETTERYMKCGILKHGFARVKCFDCGEEYLLPFSCKSRLCPSCMTKTMLQFQEYIQENIIQKVPHRHMVFCLPKILRRGFIRNRGYLNELSRITWKTAKEYMQKTLKKEGIPGGIQIIQTHGNLIGLNPHIHLLVSDGIS